MFETGMSALVLKICSEYAKSLGLNFPPCTQQEINAICQWVDKHTVKDLTMEQNGDSVTFKFVTENDTTKEFTFSIPEQKVDVNVLEQLLIGSDTVVVNRTEDNSKLQVRLAQSVTTQINGKLDKPATPTAESAVVIGTDGTTSTKPLSEIGGGKLYKHDVTMGHVALGTLAFESISCINVSFVDNNFANFPNFVVFLNDIRPTFNGKTVKKITKYEEHGSYGRGIMISYSDSTSEYLEFVTFVNQPIIDNVKAE